MSKVIGAVILMCLGTVASFAIAQKPSTADELKMSREMGGVTDAQTGGELPGHPHTKKAPVSKRPMSKERDDPKMSGDMGDHPHQASGRAGKRPMSTGKDDPRMRGDMGDHPHTGSTSATTK